MAIACFNVTWYEFDVSIQKDLSYIMLRSQLPLNLKMGPFGNVSRASLKQVYCFLNTHTHTHTHTHTYIYIYIYIHTNIIFTVLLT